MSQRLTVDLMRVAAGVPSVAAVRRMNLSAVVAARAQCPAHPRWIAIFSKAFAIVAQEMPELRRAYLSFPQPHFYEYPTSVAMIFIGRDNGGGEPVHLGYIIRDPASLALVEIDKRISLCVELPIDQVGEFRRLKKFAGLPLPLRRFLMWLGYNIGRQRPKYFGTFAVTVPPADYVAPRLSAWTTRLSYGRLGRDGAVEVSFALDHRVVDGPTGARALARLEDVLNGPIVQELRT